jgi:hypothetical protein
MTWGVWHSYSGFGAQHGMTVNVPGGSITFAAGSTAISQPNNTGTPNPITASGMSFPSEQSGRYCIVGLAYDTGAASLVTALTIGGNSATRIANNASSGSNGRTEFWAAQVSSGTSMDVVITYTTTFMKAITIMSCSVLGANGTPVASDSKTFSFGAQTVTVTTPSNGLFLVVGYAPVSRSYSNITTDLTTSAITAVNGSTYYGYLGHTGGTGAAVTSGLGTQGPLCAIALTPA